MKPSATPGSTGVGSTVDDGLAGGECPTCQGDGVLITDAIDKHGERTDEIIDCPRCSLDDYRELDDEREDDLGALERWWP